MMQVSLTMHALIQEIDVHIKARNLEALYRDVQRAKPFIDNQQTDVFQLGRILTLALKMHHYELADLCIHPITSISWSICENNFGFDFYAIHYAIWGHQHQLADKIIHFKKLALVAQPPQSISVIYAAFIWDLDYLTTLLHRHDLRTDRATKIQVRKILSELLSRYNQQNPAYLQSRIQLLSELIEKQMIDYTLVNDDGETIFIETVRQQKWDILEVLLDDYLLTPPPADKVGLSQVFVECARHNQFQLAIKCLQLDTNLYSCNRVPEYSLFALFWSKEPSMTAMHWAIHHRNHDFLVVLLNMGMAAHCLIQGTCSPYDYAKQQENKIAVELIDQHERQQSLYVHRRSTQGSDLR